MLAENDAGRLGIDEDVSFHMAIAFATKNPVQVHIMKTFYDLLHYGIKENLQALWEEPASLPIIGRQHQGSLPPSRTTIRKPPTRPCKEHITFVLDFVRSRKLLAPWASSRVTKGPIRPGVCTK